MERAKRTGILRAVGEMTMRKSTWFAIMAVLIAFVIAAIVTTTGTP